MSKVRSNDMRTWIKRRPFRAFRIHLSSGVTFEIRHPEQVALSQHTVDIGVLSPGPPEDVETDVMVSLAHVTHLEALAAPSI